MKRTNHLKGLRLLLAILFFVPLLLYFVDFARVVPEYARVLLHLQLVPAILAGAVGIVVFQFLLVLVFGRIYCSVICPAGVFQDVANRLFCMGRKKKKGSRRFSFRRPLNILRYVVLGLTVALALLGVIDLALGLDPYSNFGRMASNLFRPAVMWSNNVLADALMKIDNYSLYHVTVSTVSVAGIVAGVVALLVFCLMAIWRGRLFCNTLCPVGALLSLVSRYSFFRISFDRSMCNGCGNCERSCKAEAIDSKAMTIDTSRCITCFNCTSSCPKNSLKYRFNPFGGKKSLPAEADKKEAANSRRSFLSTGATVALSLPAVSAVAQAADGRGHRGHRAHRGGTPVTPPGSISLSRFKDTCTACHICVVKCPSQVLVPAGLEFGFGYLLRPYLSYKSHYCNYECTVCSDVCPVHALKPLTVEEKKTTQVGIATFHKGRCIVHTEGTDCGACSEHCPTQAVHMVPYSGVLTIPKVEEELCIGCGGCESICPVKPLRAIVVQANEEHRLVKMPEVEEVKEIEIEDFGF